MKNTEKPNLDKLIEETVREQIINSSPPPVAVTDAWEQVKQRLDASRNHSKLDISWQKKMVYAASVLLVFIGLTALLSQQSFAFTRLTDIFLKIEDAMVQLVTRSGDVRNKPGAPSNDEFTIVEGSEVVTKQMSLEEASQNTAFTIVIPRTLPAGFTLKNVTVLKEGTEKSKEIFLNYEGNSKGFIVNEKLAGAQMGTGTIVDREDTTIEQVSINGQKGSLLTFKNGTTNLIWITNSYYYSIEGKLSKEEIIAIAKSM